MVKSGASSWRTMFRGSLLTGTTTMGESSPAPGLGMGVTREADDVVVDVAEDDVDIGSFEEVV